MVKAKFAVIAFIHHAMVIRRGKFRDITFVVVDPIKKRIERRAQIKTTAATVAHIINAQGFLFERDRIDGVKQA